MADMQSAAAEIRRGRKKKKEERTLPDDVVRTCFPYVLMVE